MVYFNTCSQPITTTDSQPQIENSTGVILTKNLGISEPVSSSHVVQGSTVYNMVYTSLVLA